METIRIIDHDGFTELCFDLPESRVNTLAARVLDEVERALTELARRPDLRGLLVTSAKPGCFIAGADIHEIEQIADAATGARLAARGQAILQGFAELPCPTVAAIDGAALGGGCELALACDWRVASDGPKTRIGLPEVQLGILPGFGGCYRMPRRVGLEQGLAMILGAKLLDGRHALKVGLVDGCIPQAIFRVEAERFLRACIQGVGKQRPPRKRSLRARLLEALPLGRKLVFAQARKGVMAKTHGHYPAALRALAVVEAAWSNPRSRAFEIEAHALGELAVSPECRALVALYFGAEQLKRESGVPGVAPTGRPVARAGVLGAGVMGGGIAQLIADREITVRMKDLEPRLVAPGVAAAHTLWRTAIDHHRLEPRDYRRRAACLTPTTTYHGFRHLDLVVEAVVERLGVKRALLAEVEREIRDDAIFATNTSSLPIHEIAAGAAYPERVIGMHFFNPVRRMVLVEVIPSQATSAATTLATVAFAKRLGKVPVVVADQPGFLVNRLLLPYLNEAALLLEEGSDVATLDALMVEFGMPMGPFTLMDAVGLDICQEVAGVLHGAFGERMRPSAILARMVETGRLGDKAGRGFYRGKGKKRRVDDTLYHDLGTRQREIGNRAAAVDRMVLAMVNEAARCLAEGVVASPLHLDMAMVLGTGFPPFRGGLLRDADRRGAQALCDRLAVLAQPHGERFTPAPLLIEMAAAARPFYPVG